MLEAEAKEQMRLSPGRPPKGEEIFPHVNSTDKKKKKRAPQSRDKASKMFGVNPRYISDSKTIKEQAPDVFEQMKAGAKLNRLIQRAS